MNPDKARIRAILESARTIAVVGLSPRPERPSNQIGRYLIAAGYRVIPVNPGHGEILGLTCYARLRDVSERIDIVDCFRRPDQILAIAEEAVAIDARVLWLQPGAVNQEAAAFAARAGVTVVMDRCIRTEHGALRVRR